MTLFLNSNVPNSLEFDWEGTSLGIRVEGDESFTYIDLQGPQGIQGLQGIQGPPGTTDYNELINTPTSLEWTAQTISQIEAEKGSSATRRAWTAKRVRQAIQAWWETIKSTIATLDSPVFVEKVTVPKIVTPDGSLDLESGSPPNFVFVVKNPGSLFLRTVEADTGIVLQVRDSSGSLASGLKIFYSEVESVRPFSCSDATEPTSHNEGAIKCPGIGIGNGVIFCERIVARSITEHSNHPSLELDDVLGAVQNKASFCLNPKMGGVVYWGDIGIQVEVGSNIYGLRITDNGKLIFHGANGTTTLAT